MKRRRIQEFISDDSGKLSSSRALVIIVVLTYLVYAGYVVVTSKVLPDIPLGVAGLVSVLYGINKLSPTVPFTELK